MIRLGLIGHPLEHSYSRILHERALRVTGKEGTYQLWDIPPSPHVSELLQARVHALRKGTIQGLNVTIPYKERILPHLDGLTSRARAIGAVNTLFGDKKGKVIGDNTDSPGFWQDVRRMLPAGDNGSQPKALILGAGGGARAVAHALLNQDWKVAVAARRITQAEELSSQFEEPHGSLETCALSPYIPLPVEAVSLIVNATPVGMAPDEDASPWPENWRFPPGAAVYDLVYHPPRTRFLEQARERGLKTRNGMGMLVEQAALAFKRWTDVEPPREDMYRAVETSISDS